MYSNFQIIQTLEENTKPACQVTRNYKTYIDNLLCVNIPTVLRPSEHSKSTCRKELLELISGDNQEKSC